MADREETPAQRQARIRRQKREAKITGTATERLDKITRLSGRTPESMRNSSPAATPPPISPPSNTPPPGASPTPPNADQVRAQEEYLRALLRQPMAQDGQDEAQQDEDPMVKMLQTFMGGMGATDPNAPDGTGAGPTFSPDDIAKATGLPSFVTNMMLGGQKAPPTTTEIRATRTWKIVHVLFSIIAGLYLVFSINRSTEIFGEDPPAPATFQNPFIVFVTGELLVQTTRIAMRGYSGKSGPRLWIQMGKELIGDGAIMVFMLGLATWRKGIL